MVAPGRKYNSGNGYRYGFNGKENDKEVKGDGNQYDYGMRIYDGRLGRWLSTDKLESKYAFSSPYVFSLNSPTRFADPDGNLIWIPDASYANELSTIIEKAFAGKIKVRIVRDEKNLHSYLKFEKINNDSSVPALSELETKAFEYLKNIADNPAFTIKMNVSQKEMEMQNATYSDGVSMDYFDGRVIYYNRLAAFNSGMDIDETGEQIIHFFAEQLAGLVPDSKGKTDNDERGDYNMAHTKALDVGVAIFNRKWTDALAMIKDNKKYLDMDYVDGNGKYICTVREIYDFTNSKKPTVSVVKFLRTDIKVGDKSSGVFMDRDSWALKTRGRKYDPSDQLFYQKYTDDARNAYYKNNPLPASTNASSNNNKATNNNSKKGKKG